MKEQYICKDSALYLYPVVEEPKYLYPGDISSVVKYSREQKAYNKWKESRIEMSPELKAVTKEGDVLTEGKEFIITGGQRKRNHDGTTTRTEKLAIIITKEAGEDYVASVQLEEGVEQWKSRCENAESIIRELVKLKNIKDTEGKTEYYLKNQPIAWKAAFNHLAYYNCESYNEETLELAKKYWPLLNSDQNAQVSDTTEDHSSNADGVQKILSDFGKRISGEAKSKTPLTEEAFKEELEKQYPLQGMKPNRFRQQGANWSFTNYTQPLLSELAEAKKEIERLKSQLDTVKKQWGIFK